jgi:hypothetical protein
MTYDLLLTVFNSVTPAHTSNDHFWIQAKLRTLEMASD